ncbi:hypothetical protein [Pseudomonas putida]|uniref:hypothetical protein n=1 Tax=Pseudomonas putida TaxID=303 RepID=UPI00236436F4|nr:hypothetical protein [Pseudomonas putida]MDD2005167.1 hypothetical protein [Pseudomonas putida]
MSMEDRELLELAAKAAGIAGDWCEPFGCLLLAGTQANEGSESWNPLADDGDALRLAVKLDLTIYGPGSHPGVLVKTAEAHTVYSDDCVRRAIVLAAAAIGQAMQEKH